MPGFVGKVQDWLVRVNAFRRNQYVVPLPILDDGTNLLIDASKSNNWKITLTGNRTLLNPLNLKEGMILNISVDQDATGARLLAYGTLFKSAGAASLALSTTALSKDLLCAYYDGSILKTSIGRGYS